MTSPSPQTDMAEHAAGPDSAAPAPQVGERDKPLVLVIDDDFIQRRLMDDVLQINGYAVEEAEDGVQGLEKISALRPDLVILDVMMPGLDGFGVCARLRENEETEHLPVLIVTALEDLSAIECAFKVGATDFLTKPVSPSLLPYRVRYILKASTTEAELRLAKQQSEEALQQVSDLSRTLEEQVEQRTTELAATQSELLDKERQLRQAQKMEALGQLAGGVAHEFNNQLTVIGGFGRAALDYIDNEDRVRESLNEIVAAADRSAALTSQMLAFSRKQMLWSKTVEVGAVIASLREMLRSMTGETVELDIDIRDDKVCAQVDPLQLSQAIINLAVNARDAMPDGGRLTIGCDTVTLRSGERLSHHPGDIVAGPYVHLFVKDTGEGIEPAMMERIFDPFFTTKELGNGTGLGLSVVFGIIKQCGGMIDVKSAPGQGAAFSIYFPVAEEQPAEIPSTVEAVSTSKGETILVAEDEGPVLNLVKLTLEDLGYKVLTAFDGLQAVKVLEQNGGDVDLLLTDVVMPKMGGIDLANAFSDLCPDKAVIYMSGYAPELSARLQHLGDDCHFLRKPFKPNDLASMVREALDTKAA